MNIDRSSWFDFADFQLSVSVRNSIYALTQRRRGSAGGNPGLIKYEEKSFRQQLETRRKLNLMLTLIKGEELWREKRSIIRMRPDFLPEQWKVLNGETSYMIFVQVILLFKESIYSLLCQQRRSFSSFHLLTDFDYFRFSYCRRNERKTFFFFYLVFSIEAKKDFKNFSILFRSRYPRKNKKKHFRQMFSSKLNVESWASALSSPFSLCSLAKLKLKFNSNLWHFHDREGEIKARKNCCGTFARGNS
jgi:hypothetical protein